MSEILETVTIVTKNGKGKTRINKSDFDPAKHEIADGEQAKPTPEKNVEPIDPNGLAVEKAANGKKFFVVDKEGNRVEADGLNKTGYADEMAAWAAIAALKSGDE